jgi:hypothetical protein
MSRRRTRRGGGILRALHATDEIQKLHSRATESVWPALDCHANIAAKTRPAVALRPAGKSTGPFAGATGGKTQIPFETGEEEQCNTCWHGRR